MIQLYDGGAYVLNGTEIIADTAEGASVLAGKLGNAPEKEEAKKQTIAYGILKDHNTSGNMDKLKIRFDKLTSHDITFVGIIQTARASGLEKFPMPYVLTNCHNSLCAVGGTINEDDHMFGLTCAKKYGGIYVPPHQAVIHQFAREMLAGGGKMILGSDSHTRYGALGTMAIGEGGGELSQGQKQLLCIARVMLAPPPMLILDEATSSIDTRTELQVQEAFDKLMKGRTSFIVAHRLSTIRNASLILVMKDGKIIEQGNHEELLGKGGFYHKLYHSQFES